MRVGSRMEQKLEALQTANEYMEKLVDGMNQCIQFYRVGDIGSANHYLLLIIDGLEWLLDVIRLTQDIRKKPIDIESFRQILTEIVEALENSDTTLIADLLEYEVLEQVVSWQEIIGSEVVA